MAEQQDNFDYNIAPLVPILQPLDVQQQQPPSSSFGETLQSLAPITEKELEVNFNSTSNCGTQVPGTNSFGDVVDSYNYELTSLENSNVVPSMTLPQNELKLSEVQETPDFTPIIDEIVRQEANDLSRNEQTTKLVDDNQQIYSQNNETEPNLDTNQSTEETKESQTEKVSNETRPENDEDEENTWSISEIKKMQLFPDQVQTTSDEVLTPVLNLSTPPIPGQSPTNELTKDNSESNLKKRRKRIMIDDSEESETEEIREEVQKSEEAVLGANKPPSPALSEKSIDSIEALEQRVEELKAIERPGPRSKKTSTQLLREIEAKTLLQNAVVIPTKQKDKHSKKHKKNLKRVLDSDEEEQVTPAIKTDLSDIGLFDGDPPQELTSESILVSENMGVGSDFFKLEGISIDEMGVVVPIENPILPEGEAQEDEEGDLNEKQDIIELESSSEHEEEKQTKKSVTKSERDEDRTKSKQNGDNTEKVAKTDETTSKENTADNEADNQAIPIDTVKAPVIKSEPIEQGHSTNSNPETTPISIKQEKVEPPLVIKQEPCTQKEAETFLADALRSQFGCDDQSKAAKKQESVDTSSTFWGRDSSSSEESGDEWQATSYVKTFSTSKQSWKKSSSSKMKKKKRKYDSDSDDYKRRKKSSAYIRSGNAKSFLRTATAPAPNALGGRPIMPSGNQKPATIRVAVRSKEELKRKVKDRFFDRSRLVPNDIYFGDVPVPLHILHAYNSDAFDSSSDSDGYNRSNRMNQSRSGYRQGGSYQGRMGNAKSPMMIKAVPIQAYRSGGNEGNNALVDTFKRYLRAAGIKKVNFARLWEGCHTSAERARAMLKLLRNKGLEGEPTLAKCRALKKKRKVEKEIQELDTSVIIDDDDGIKTRRSTRQVSVKKEDEVPVEAVETLNKLKQVVDSESD